MTELRRLLAFTAVVFRSVGTDRVALFFIIVLPVIIIVIIGTTFGGQPRLDVGVVGADGGPLATELSERLEGAEGIETRFYDDVETLRSAVRRQTVAIGVVIPSDFDARLVAGEPVELGELASPDAELAFTARVSVSGVVDGFSTTVGAAQGAAEVTGRPFSETLPLAEAATGGQGETVAVEDVGNTRASDLSQFSLTAPQNLVLFVFINAMAVAVMIVRARRRGVLRRGLATPTSMTAMLTGLGLGWFAFALAQSAVIVGIGALLFGVNWGDPVGAIALALVFALVGCGAGLLVGAIGQNEDRVAAITPPLGIVLGALGGCMVPLEVFPPAMRTIAHVTPHFWAVDSWERLIFDGDGIGAILPALAVLLAFAAVFAGAAATLLRRRLTG